MEDEALARLVDLLEQHEAARQRAEDRAHMLVDTERTLREVLDGVLLQRDVAWNTATQNLLRAQEAEARLAEAEGSGTYRLLQWVRRYPRLSSVALRLVRAVTSVRPTGPAELPLPAESPATSRHPFAGIARRASAESLEALVAARPDVLGICHPDWRGIRAATYGHTPHVLELDGIHSARHLNEVVSAISAVAPRAVVVEGVPPGTSALLSALKARLPGTLVNIVFHGSPAQHGVLSTEIDALDAAVNLARIGAIDRLGFAKAGLAEYFQQAGIDAFEVGNRVDIAMRAPRPRASSTPDVGVFLSPTWGKNMHTQVAAACLIPNAHVHTSVRSHAIYLSFKHNRVTAHGVLPREPFLELLARMDLNMNVSLTECAPMTVIESVALGVPCLISDTSVVFDDDAAVREALVVTAHDNPTAIALAAKAVLDAGPELTRRAQDAIHRYGERSAAQWKAFVA